MFNRPLTEDYYYANLQWKVLSFKQGINHQSLDNIFDQVLRLLSHHSKILAVRFDLHLFDHTNNNKLISHFTKQLKKQIQRKYSKRVGFVWARERTSQDTMPHYHYAVFVNGHKINKSYSIYKMVEIICKKLGTLRHYFPKNGFYNIQRGNLKSIQRVLVRLSYLAKNESKDTLSGHKANYQTSRLVAHEFTSPFV